MRSNPRKDGISYVDQFLVNGPQKFNIIGNNRIVDYVFALNLRIAQYIGKMAQYPCGKTGKIFKVVFGSLQILVEWKHKESFWANLGIFEDEKKRIREMISDSKWLSLHT
jgi:hypothetical protein